MQNNAQVIGYVITNGMSYKVTLTMHKAPVSDGESYAGLAG